MQAPEIWGISLKNYKLLQDSLGNKHIEGDIYAGKKCIGYFNPIYQAQEGGMPQMFVKLTDDSIREKYSGYKSIYDFEGTEKYINDTMIIPRGLNVLLEDLERLIVLYESMKGAKDYKLVVGIINDETMKIFPFIKDPPEDVNKENMVEFIEDQIGMCFDGNYPVLLFMDGDDFVFKKSVIRR